jgi:SAM-dependent methyltransferase
VQVARRILGRLLSPILQRQTAYNLTNARLVEDLQHAQADLRTHVAAAERHAREALEAVGVEHGRTTDLHGGLAALARGLEELRIALTDVGRRSTDLYQELAALAHGVEEIRVALGDVASRLPAPALGERLARNERELRRVSHVLAQQSNGDRPDPGSPPIVQPLLDPPLDYFGFEERFRGDESYIREKQRAYLGWFEGRRNVLDVGSGRGEFLELLREAGVPAVGVDANLDMVLACRQKGLEVVHRDAFGHLTSLPDASLGGMFAAQIVEHFEAPAIFEFVRLAYRKLEPGAALVVETINPTCLTVFAESFYADFTHVRPIHPEALRYLFESTGFGAVEVRYSSPVDAATRIPPLPGEDQAVEQFNQAMGRLNNLLYGFRDYAVIGIR